MKTVIVDFRITPEESESLKKLGLDIILCQPCRELYPSLCGHPDMQLTIIDNKNIVVHKHMDEKMIQQLSSLGVNLINSNSELNENYPQDIILNSLIMGDIFIHKINTTDPVLLKMVKEKKLINVKQGYTKCSTAVLHDKAAVTSDLGIAEVLRKEGVDVLLIPSGDIDLPGLNYGFIGGACGLIDEGRLAFFGELNHYAYGSQVLAFLEKHHIEPVYLKRGRLVDRGTLFCIST
jgi:predicted Fe-Mo cluster-binding NifX family protein